MLASILNYRRLVKLTIIDQFIMAFGGLRGGIAFCLALSLKEDLIPERKLFITATIVIIFFTVFVQVKYLMYCAVIVHVLVVHVKVIILEGLVAMLITYMYYSFCVGKIFDILCCNCSCVGSTCKGYHFGEFGKNVDN